MTRFRWLNLVFVGALLPPNLALANEDNYLTELIQASRQQSLAQQPYWHTLLHYKPRLLPGAFKSQVDAPGFFQAADGKSNPRAELEATLSAFFAPLPSNEDAQQLHAQCRFVARYHWLRQALNFDLTRLPKHSCQRFEAWIAALNPAGITLIFPTAYMNSPASMFGHTLLRIDAHGQDERTRLLAYALNFGANTGNDGGIGFALKGLLGGYAGVFSLQPYYLKVREYSDMENRAIWEYQLDLSQQEVERVLMHAWEMRGIWFDYFFFDENCSYHLLSLLETARPGLDLTNRFKWWAIPSDTVREAAAAGLIKTTVYRPSRREQLEVRSQRLAPTQVTQMQQLAARQLQANAASIQALPTAQQAEVLELAHQLTAYQRTAKNQADHEALQHELLQARSRLDYLSPAIDIPRPASRPDQGHDTARLSLGLGRADHRTYQALEIHPAYHDLLDPDQGYTTGAQIKFFSLAWRREQNTGNTRLQHFIPVDIVSLAPVSDISQPKSWRFSFGWRRKQHQQQTALLASINGAMGRTWGLTDDVMGYALAEADLNGHHDLEKGFALGLGPNVGLLVKGFGPWASHAYFNARQYPWGEQHSEISANIELRYSINLAQQVKLTLARKRELAETFNQAELSWQWFF